MTPSDSIRHNMSSVKMSNRKFPYSFSVMQPSWRVQKHIVKSMYFNFGQVNETLIPYTKVTAVHHQTLSKKNENWKIDINNLSVRSLQGLLLLFVDKQNDFANENEKFYNPSIKKILTVINGIPQQLYPGGVLSEAKKYFYEFLTTKFGLWIDLRSINDNRLHGSGRTVETSEILLQIERAADVSDGDLVCYIFSLTLLSDSEDEGFDEL